MEKNRGCLQIISDDNHSFSSFYSKRTNLVNALLVEGDTDYKFYQRLWKGNVEDIFCKSPYEDKQDNSICELVEETQNDTNVFGIIDADYKTHQIEEKIKEKILVIDANSLETLLIKYAKIEPFEKFLRTEKKSKITNIHRIRKDFSITQTAIEWAFLIGCLRQENENKSLYLSFSKLKERNKQYLRDFIIKSEKDNTIKFNFEKFLSSLCEVSKKYNGDVYELEEIVKKYIPNIDIQNPKLTWQGNSLEGHSWDTMCQGHDIFDFIDCISRFENTRRESKVPQWEYGLISNYDLTNCKGHLLRKWFNQIILK